MPQAGLRVLKAAGDTRVAGEIELDQGIIGMQFARPEQNRLRFFDALAAACRIGQTYPPARFFGLDLHEMTGHRARHLPFLGG